MVGCVLLCGNVGAHRDCPASGGDDISKESLVELVSAIEEVMRDGLLFDGELLVRQEGEVLLQTAVSSSAHRWAGLWESDAVCNMGSMTGVYTGAAAQILIDRGQLSLDDSVSKYIESFDTDAARAITIDHLLTHRSGLPYAVLSTGELYSKFANLRDMVDAIGARGPEVEAGDRVRYSVCDLDTLAAVIEVVSGSTIDVFLAEELFGPLGMTRTFFSSDVDDARFGDVDGESLSGEGSQIRFSSIDGSVRFPFPMGSYSAFGTLSDCSKFMAMWMNGGVAASGERILSDEAMARTFEPQCPTPHGWKDLLVPTGFSGMEVWSGRATMLLRSIDSPRTTEALGFVRRDGVLAWCWPGRKLMVLCFTPTWKNLMSTRVEYAIDRCLLDAVESAAEAVLPSRLEGYAGAYTTEFEFPGRSDYIIAARGSRLTLQSGTAEEYVLLEPTSDGRMSIESSPLSATISFERDEEGEAFLMRWHTHDGLVYNLPRRDSLMHTSMVAYSKIDVDEVQPLLGEYEHESSDKGMHVYLDGTRLMAKNTPDHIEFELMGTTDPLVFRFRTRPYVSLRFHADDDGNIVTVSTEVRNEGVRWVMKKVGEATKGGGA